ncbi:MAG: four helix bundle protein [Muribaculaceae bacterium]|nr:four helix bundle protein [Muribaculaceae bacterium]
MKTSCYKELRVWQRSMDLTEEVYTLVRQLPREEVYALSEQMRRAAVSVPSNIAEGHGRNSHKDFVKFLGIARGSLLELETQLEICGRLKYIPSSNLSHAFSIVTEISKMLNALISYRSSLIS